jgi:Ran GTPase-activating protein (RanGAP) involved in mRNA processing and transport
MDIADDPVPFLPPFQSTDLFACRIPATGFSAFCNAVSHNTALGMFACQHNPIRDKGTMALARVLNAWTGIRQLDLGLCETGNVGTKARFAAVEVSPTLHRDPAALRAELSELEGTPDEE